MGFRYICSNLFFVPVVVVLWSCPNGIAAENHVMVSWGDQVIVYGPGTDAALDSPQAVDAMMKRLKGRGFTGIAWRADLADFEPNELYINDTGPAGAVLVNGSLRSSAVFPGGSALPYAQAAAEANGLEFWLWVTSVYSDGSPQSYPTMYDGQYHGPFTIEHAYVREHPEVLTIDRYGNPYYGQREYAYNGAKWDKVNEMVYFARQWGIKNIIACMRSESSQYQPAPDKADRYGFNQPIVNEMLSRYGINILTNPKFDVDSGLWDPTDADVQKWHDLRGEYLTQFYRDLRTTLNAYPDTKIGVMIPGGDYIGPVIGNIRVDWRTWIDEGLVYQFILPQTLAATEDWDSPAKGYLTDNVSGTGILPVGTFKDYAMNSAHPETRFLHTGGDRYHRTNPPAGADGWRTWIDRESFDLGWYQRWRQWKRDLLEFGHIKFFEQNFDDFPEYSSGNNTGWGEYRYVPGLRCCPGLWWPLGDGNDTYATAQSEIAHSGRAIRLSRPADFYVRHLTVPDRKYIAWSIDNAVMNGNCSLDFWAYRPASTSILEVYLTQELNKNTGFGLQFLASSTKYRKYQNGSYYWFGTLPAVVWPVGTWQKFSIHANVDNKTYSAYMGASNEFVICSDVPYSSEVDYMNMLLFSPTNQVCYIDDVAMKWVPTLHYSPKGKNTHFADEFESHTEHQTAHNTIPDVGAAWQVNPASRAAWFVIEHENSYGDGWKCLAVPRLSDGTTISSSDSDRLTLEPNNVVTLDLDVFVEPGKGTVFGLAESSASPHVAAVKLVPIDSNSLEVQCWNGDNYVDSGRTVWNDGYLGTWYHFQFALDCATRTYKVVSQQSGTLPVLAGTYNWGDETQVGDSILFRIDCVGPLTGSYPYVYYDNIEMHYGLPDECGDEFHPYPAGDFSQDCTINNEDLRILVNNWLGIDQTTDMDNNGKVDFTDFARFAEGWLN